MSDDFDNDDIEFELKPDVTRHSMRRFRTRQNRHREPINPHRWLTQYDADHKYLPGVIKALRYKHGWYFDQETRRRVAEEKYHNRLIQNTLRDGIDDE